MVKGTLSGNYTRSRKKILEIKFVKILTKKQKGTTHGGDKNPYLSEIMQRTKS